MLQLMFDFENDSEADAKTATSFAPAATAASKPWKEIYTLKLPMINADCVNFRTIAFFNRFYPLLS